MVTKVVPSRAWVVVVPFLVVNRDSHFSGIAVVKTIRAAVVVVAPVVLWVRDVRIVVEAVQILGTLLAPSCSVGRLLGLRCFRLVHDGESTNANRNCK